MANETQKLGVTSSGKVENCTAKYNEPCSRHTSHLDLNELRSKKEFPFEIEVNDNLEETGILSFNAYLDLSDEKRAEIKSIVDEMHETASRMAESWQHTLDEVTRIHDETTVKLAQLRNMTVEEYQLWLANYDTAKDKGLWLQAEADSDDYITKAKWVTPIGETVEIETTNIGGVYNTKFTRFIGDKKFSTFDIGQPFKISDARNVEVFIKENII